MPVAPPDFMTPRPSQRWFLSGGFLSFGKVLDEYQKVCQVPFRSTNTMTTALTCSHDHLIRALYDAKAALKDAAAECKTADHNYKSCCSDMEARSYDLKRLVAACAAADEHYYRVEKTYDAIHAVCTKLNLI